MAGIMTTNGAIILAVRAHHHMLQMPAGNLNLPTQNERAGQNIICIESARLFAGGCMETARNVRDQLEAMTDEQFWAHEFNLHPTLMQFVHHQLV